MCVCVCVRACAHASVCMCLIQHNLICTDNSSTLHISVSAISDSSVAHEGGRKKRKWSSFMSLAQLWFSLKGSLTWQMSKCWVFPHGELEEFLTVPWLSFFSNLLRRMMLDSTDVFWLHPCTCFWWDSSSHFLLLSAVPCRQTSWRGFTWDKPNLAALLGLPQTHRKHTLAALLGRCCSHSSCLSFFCCWSSSSQAFPWGQGSSTTPVPCDSLRHDSVP